MTQNLLNALLQEIPASFAHRQSIVEMAKSLTDIDLEQWLLAFQLLGEGLASAILNHLPPDIQAELLQAMDAGELIRLLEAMEPESRHQLLVNLSTETIDCLIVRLNEEFQAGVHALFDLPQGSRRR